MKNKNPPIGKLLRAIATTERSHLWRRRVYRPAGAGWKTMAQQLDQNWMQVNPAYSVTSYQHDSTAVGDRLQITVAEPVGGWRTNGVVPALYALDPFITLEMVIGLSRLFSSFSGGQIPPTMVVGVGYPTSEPGQVMALRARDLTPTLQGFPPEFPIKPPFGLGGASRFLRALAEEIIPGIENRYSVHPTDRTLIGYSFSGLFGLYTLFHRPKTFTRYLLVSPSMWWDQEVIFSDEQVWAENHTDLPARVFLAAGEGEENEGQGWLNENVPDNALRVFRQAQNLRRLATLLGSRRYPSFYGDHVVFPEEYHLTVFPAALARGLRTLFAEAEDHA